jgi:3-hydroxyisobutyrate dehydrogenase-like beta-hydroxyacid dehydrogenase
VTATAVGFAGLGVMGTAMAGQLLDAGYPVQVYNRTATSANALRDQGATVAASPHALAENCSLVLSCLLDTNAVRAVYLGDNGFVRGLQPGSIFVEHGTFDPDLATEIATTFAASGAQFIDMPVTGGPESARQGTLVGMAGGDAAAVEGVCDVVRCYTDRVEYAGQPGNGLRLKLVNQLLVSEHLVAAAEAAALIQRLQLPRAVAERVLNAGWGHSTMLARSLPKALTGDFASTGATLQGLVEVQRLVSKLASQSGVRLHTFAATTAAFAEAVDQQHGWDDPAVLVQLCLPAEAG